MMLSQEYARLAVFLVNPIGIRSATAKKKSCCDY